MTDPVIDGEFWDKRAQALGHTGWANLDLYRYDQPIRIAAVTRTLKRLGIWPGPGTRVLDIGCGSGDFARAFAMAGASVLAVDLSSQVIHEARRRARELPSVEFRVGTIEDLSVEPLTIDLVTSVTVLQHIPEQRLDQALAAISQALKPGGHLLALELAPKIPVPHASRAYVYQRSRDEWVRRFADHGLQLRAEESHPQLAVILLNRIAKRRAAIRQTVEGAPAGRLRRLAYRSILAACWPVDRVLAIRPPSRLALYGTFVLTRRAPLLQSQQNQDLSDALKARGELI